jgi:hypothetical protein
LLPNCATAGNIVISDLTEGVITITPDSNFEGGFTSTSSVESGTFRGIFIANTATTGSALIGFTERPGSSVLSDLLQLQWTNNGNIETITGTFQSDPLAAPAPPTVTVPENGATGVEIASLGIPNFPSNITIQVLSDIDPVPEPASIALLGVGIAGIAGYGWRRRQRRA